MLIKNNNLPYFSGTVALGLSHQSLNPMVAVWTRGIVLNDTAASPHQWPSPDGRDAIANWPVGHPILINKSVLADQMKIIKLNSQEIGYKLYRETGIGDVLYITYDDNQLNWFEAIRLNRIDRRTKIHLPALVGAVPSLKVA